MRGRKHLLPNIAWNRLKVFFSDEKKKTPLNPSIHHHHHHHHPISGLVWWCAERYPSNEGFLWGVFPRHFSNRHPRHRLPSASAPPIPRLSNTESKRLISKLHSSFQIVTTGTQTSKQGPVRVRNVAGLNGRQKLLHFIAGSLYIRNLVSRQRRRMLIAGYDLDMSYITDRLLAMSFPAEHMRAMYRNPLWQVRDVLEMKHPGHYKVYNLCAEESYDPSHFHGRVVRFPFDDNYVPSLSMMKLFCESVHTWLSADPQNIAVIHCMAGKGRTGLMVCAYLVYSGMPPDEALQLYAHRRTTDNNGVSIASQLRYVRYWSEMLTFPREMHNGPPSVSLPQPTSRELRRIRVYDAVNTKSVFFVVSELEEVPDQLYRPPVELARNCCREIKQGYQRTNSPRYYVSFIDNEGDEKLPEEEAPRFVVQMDTESSAIDQKTCLDYYFDKPLLVSGDVRVTFSEKLIGGRLFYLCFNTAFITSSLLQFSLEELDKVGRKGKSISGPSFCVELLFGPANAKHPTICLEDHCEET